MWDFCGLKKKKIKYAQRVVAKIFKKQPTAENCCYENLVVISL